MEFGPGLFAKKKMLDMLGTVLHLVASCDSSEEWRQRSDLNPSVASCDAHLVNRCPRWAHLSDRSRGAVIHSLPQSKVNPPPEREP